MENNEKVVLSKLPLITIHLEGDLKEKLKRLANKDRVCLSTYCRLLLAKHAQEYRNAKPN